MLDQQLIHLCMDIADASGGLFGLGKRVSKDEQNVIAEIARSLGEPAVKALRARLSSDV
jgi:hypothetical protein